MGVFKKVRGLGGVVTRPFKEVYEPAKHSFESVRDTVSRERDPAERKKAQQAIDELRSDFALVESRWGFTEKQRPTIIRNLRIDGALCCGLAALGIVSVITGLGSGFVYLLAGTCMFIVASIRACVCFWRADVLAEKQFVSFREWAFQSNQAH